MKCPLCDSVRIDKFSEDKWRPYFKCSDCSLIFVPRNYIISPDAEVQRYQSHQNDELDPQYRTYLTEIVDKILPHLKAGSIGLDFGCGKTTLMEKIFKGHDFSVDSYDIYFHPQEDIWKKQYDFIILSEVIEHLSDPDSVMLKLSSLLKSHGQIFIKTKLYPADVQSFDQWFYKRDQTHVQFFDAESLLRLGVMMKMKGPIKLGEDLFQFKE